MLKKYQVLETECGEWGVFNVDDLTLSVFKSEYAAEAQEKADELNGVSAFAKCYLCQWCKLSLIWCQSLAM